MTGPTPPVPGQPPGPAGAAGAASRAPGGHPVRIEAVVIGSTRHGAVIETASGRLLLAGTPPLPRGASLTLQTVAAPDAPARPARLLAIDGRALGPPRPVQLAALPSPAPPHPAPTLPAQVIAPAARAGGPPIAVQITPLPDSRGAAPTPADPAAGLPPGAALAAEASGRDAFGRPLLRAPGVILRLEPAAVDLPPGSRVRLVFPQGLPPATAPRRSEDPLRTLVDVLRAQGGAPVARALPRPDATLAAQLMRLHQAIQRGEPSLLHGKETPPAPRPAEAVPERPALREALAELTRLAHERLPGGWRASLLPVMVEGAPAPLRLYLRDEDGAASGAAEVAVRRAVFDLDLSHLGRLQLDALCQGRRFDLLLRSERALPPALRADVAALFEAAKEVTGLRGELGFRPGGLLALPDPRAPPVRVTA